MGSNLEKYLNTIRNQNIKNNHIQEIARVKPQDAEALKFEPLHVIQQYVNEYNAKIAGPNFAMNPTGMANPHMPVHPNMGQ